MTSGSARWSDLGTRLISAAVLAAVSAAAIWFAGPIFLLYVAVLAVAVTWEQSRMFDRSPYAAPILASIVMVLGVGMPDSAPALVAASALVFGASAKQDRILAGLSNALVLFGALCFIYLAGDAGLMTLLWLIGIVVLTDLGGYFGGRLIGGPKLWPAVSPKKTWSGTLTGWAAAALFTLVFPGIHAHGPWLILAAVILSAASQAGDLFESHVKRKRGIKDSSNLIPGHGGVWDRFDGMLAASIAAWIVAGH